MIEDIVLSVITSPSAFEKIVFNKFVEFLIELVVVVVDEIEMIVALFLVVFSSDKNNTANKCIEQFDNVST